ncbi:alpha-L-rhamnosidase N-terminal domain-containing protein [Actinophytocola oryzae]|uniref:alpha-L-rhamnosidase n=1 Tax=Actinophytocola oryzae TaxID=502181 RepID=A0A4R7W057_9PSEU|nr:alpha-L-rhamnosidase N-terminal domain-containing protein [Actinophytocola oryzae]TDV54907.1 alpha-L-rhamnosidase-like protein [Actinophytocola oryzae]
MRRRGLSLVFVVAAVLTTFLTTVAATSSANHSPGAPERLTVDGRVSPLAIDGVPHFSWLPTDRDDDEVQTAYQVVVRRGDRVVWDSGRVASTEQSWVAGPSLPAGTSYRWTVRTWDRRGAASPFAPPAAFDTGIGDGDWSGAAWVRRDTTGNDAANEWTLARRVIPVGKSRVTRARVYVAAVGDWELRVDGRSVTRGSSYGYPGEGYYDVAAPEVRAWRPLAIGIRYHYWNCRCQGRANGPVDGPSGLLVKVVVEHADGTREVTVSDSSWRLSRDTAEDVSTITYRNSDSGDVVEHHDATLAQTGWDTTRFDDTAWAPATVVGRHPRPTPESCTAYGSSPCTITHLAAQQAHVSRTTVRPVSVKRLPDGTLFADMGEVVSAVPRIGFRDGTAGHQVTVTTSYRRNNTTLAAAVAPGATTLVLADATGVHPGDEIVVDAPASGFGPGDPETRTVTSTSPQGTVLDRPLRKAHAAGTWVENSRAGRSGLDTQGSDLRYLYTQKAGRQTAEPFTYWGWRYLEIADPGERLPEISAVVQSTDVRRDEAATFSSSDRTLDAVFDLMRHSALMSAQNVFLDTPTREKGQFLGDAIDISFATMAALGERSLTRQAIVEFAHSQSRYWPNGAMNAVYPNGDGRRDIPDYTEMFPEWVMRYHQLTGDDSLVAQVFPALRGVADYLLASVDDTGLVHQLPGGSGAYGGGIIDWPAPMRYDYVVTDNGSRTVVNALAVGALRAVAAAARVTGDPIAATYDQRADAITAAMNDRLRDPSTGRYSDGLALSTGQRIDSFAEHSQSFPIAYGVAPRESYADLSAYLDELGMRQGPMTLRQLLTALERTGRTDTLVRLLTDPEGDGPARTLAEGGTFMWEQWTPGCAVAGCTGADVSQRSSESLSHGWGAAGITGILRGLLGVAVTSPGAATVTVTPPATGLDRASGTVWTERGPLRVKWTNGHRGTEVDITVPVNVTATVVLPNGSTHTVGSGHSHVAS